MADPLRQKQRIAILGGGVGAMTTAYALTDVPGWQERYEVTVYQMGWRLGGKGASGRNHALGDRIEEHGLHIWLGFYHNAFRMIRQCYQELGRPAGAPLAGWQDAFKPHSSVTFMEQVDGRWLPWTVDFPTNDAVPGDGGEFLKPWDYVRMMLNWMVQQAERMRADLAAPGPAAGHRAVAWVGRVLHETGTVVRLLKASAARIEAAVVQAWEAHFTPDATPLHHAQDLADSLPGDPEAHPAQHHQALVWLLEEFVRSHLHTSWEAVRQNDTLRRMWCTLDLAQAIIKGMILDGVLYRGFDAIDKYDFKEWIQKHGVRTEHLWSAPVRSVYDLVFGFVGGDAARPNVAAGTALRNLFRTFFLYKGAISWRMQAGMGDVVFGPLYEVLKRRGVKFQFFHRVDKLCLSADRKVIDRIEVSVQARVKEDVVRRQGGYEPLVPVKGLPCWPTEPLYDQLVEGEQLRQQRVNLESAWTTWPNVDRRSLERGKDFDLVVLGISLGALPHLCQELLVANPRWQDMIDHVQTVQTQAFQIWLNQDAAALGWQSPYKSQGCTYVEPLDSWADMSHLLDKEDWPADDAVKNVTYFCGVLSDAERIPAPFTDPAFPESQAERVRQNALAYLRADMRPLWPGAMSPQNPTAFNWDLLVDLSARQGEARFAAQFWRANVDPSERYVLSVKGSTAHRLRAGESGFDNLYLAGDWVRTNVNSGCVEAAVMAGLAASRAICGSPQEIVGERDM